jgi:hypothetical protein
MTAQNPVLGVDGVIALPPGWDNVWKAARDASNTAPAWITAFGASLSYGQVATDQITKGWLGILRSQLLARGYQEYAQFYSPNYASGWDLTNPWKGTTPPFTLASNFTKQPGGLVAFPDYASGSTFPMVTFNPSVPATAIEALYWDTLSGTWSYALDPYGSSGASGTITQTNTGLLTKLTFTGLPSRPHSIAMGGPGQSNMMRIVGGSAYPNGTTGNGIGFARVNAPGLAYAGFFGGNAVIPADACLTWQGSAGPGAPATGFGFPTQPHLAIFEGALDLTNVGIMSGIRVLDRLCQAVRRGRRNCSIMFILPATCGDASDDDTALFAGRNSWHLWCLMIQNLAMIYNAAFVNIDQRWSDQGVALGYQGQGNVHALDAGHLDWGTLVASLL